MINIITIDFWSLDLRIAKEVYKEIDDFLRRKTNPFLLKDINTKLEYNK